MCSSRHRGDAQRRCAHYVESQGVGPHPPGRGGRRADRADRTGPPRLSGIAGLVRMSNFGRNLALWVIIALLLVVLFNLFQPGVTHTSATQMAYSDFLTEVNTGRVRDVVIQGRTVSGQLTDGRTFQTYTPEDPALVGRLTDKGVRVIAKPEDNDVNPLLHLLLSWFPMLLLIGVWVFFMRQMQSGGGRAMGFGKSRARMLTEKQGRVTFDDVAGIDEAKAELQEIVEFLKDPQKFQRLGGKIPKGVLLVGPPGTGKTLLARAIAGEANVPFFTISGSDFVEMFVGVGASRVRDMFEQGKKNAPCIIFIDEIDAVGRHRGAGLGGGNDEREQTLNQLLVEMDGFEANEGVILIAATNRPDVLDPALLRPGRFDRQINVPNPDINGREKILNVHLKNVPLSADVDVRTLARGTPGFSGADLANLVNEAALMAARRNKRMVSMVDFEHAKDKVMMGAERKSMAMSEQEKRNTAYHEGGHALVALAVPGADPVHKATIIPRGRALGLTMQLPTEDKYTYRKQYVEAQISILMGGRVAEEMFLNHVTTGAGNDIEQATELARRMVCEFGMSDMGPLAYGKNQQEIFLGRDLATQRDFSEDTAIKIDQEVKKFVMHGYERAKDVLTSNRDALIRIAENLLEREVLDSNEVKLLVDGKPLPERIRPEPPKPPEAETTQIIKPKPSPGLPGRERPQPA